MGLKFVISQKGKKQLISNGYIYSLHSNSKNVHWRCCKYKKLGCKAWCITTSDARTGSIIKEDEHPNHVPDCTDIEVRKVVSRIKKKAKKCNTAMKKIVADVVGNLSSPVAAKLPDISYLACVGRRIRRELNPVPENPSNLSDFVIPEAYTVTLKNDKFLLYDSGGKKRILIYSTVKNLQVLMSCDQWYADGTFKVVPNVFYQLYTIHGNHKGKIIPLIFMLLPNKQKKTYKRCLDALKDLGLNRGPIRLMVDFENAFINAFKEVYSETEVNGCMFHFCQCMRRHVQQCGLQKAYSEDIKVAAAIRSLTALAFVPTDNVIQAYELLIKSPYFVDNDDKLNGVLGYFEENWIGVLQRNGGRKKPMYNVELWNVYELVLQSLARTNNSVEGWHNGFSGRAQANHLNLWLFIELLKKEQGIIELEIEQVNAGGGAAVVRKKKYRDADNRILKIEQLY